MTKHRIGIIGLGKIAQDQHVPMIQANPNFELVAVSSQRGVKVVGVPHSFTDHREMLRLSNLDAVAICTPPQVRHVIARECLEAGKHVLLEKPPGATVSEVIDLKALAEAKGRVLFATWHSRHNRGVEEARKRLQGERVRRLLITWKEDAHRWHPGQSWLWEAGGFGVFDPGINALSILTYIMPETVVVRGAEMQVPSNKQAPVAVGLTFGTGREGTDWRAVFDFRQTGPQTWDIEIETEGDQKLTLKEGGTKLFVDGRLTVEETWEEYRGIYETFDRLLREGRSDVDDSPLRLVADAFLIGRRTLVEEFHE